MAKHWAKQNELGLSYRSKSVVKHKRVPARNPRSVKKDDANAGLGRELLVWGLTHHLDWTMNQIEQTGVQS